MNYRMIANTLGRMMAAEALLLLLPAAVSWIYGETCGFAFLWAVLAAVLIALPLLLFCRPKNQLIFAREGFLIVSLTWILFSVVGALPFVISGEIPQFADAFFETVSGLTTTGASILTDVESMSKGLLFWRSFTHWIGGMGVLVFVMALLPELSGRPIHILRAEMPGPSVGKLVPRIKDTAKILYLIYIAMTLLEIVLLLCGGMTLFDSMVHAFGTAGTGGFGTHADSIASYNPYIQWVITVFMLLFGINFNVFYFLLIRRFRTAFRNAELWTYSGIFLGALVIITLNISSLYDNFGESLRMAAFQISSVMTTTGYATTDFNLWPSLSKTLLLLLMFLGGCAGSTAGGLKVSRVLILGRSVRRELRHMLHPRSVNTVKMDGKAVDENTVSGVGTYFALYAICLAVIFLVLSFEPFGMETNFSAAVACFNNVGPGFDMVGPVGNYSAYSVFSKYVLSVAMLLGRLEIYPLLLIALPATWRKKR